MTPDRSISLGSVSSAAEEGGKAQGEGDAIAMEFAKEGLRLSFPCKLFAMLEDAEEKGFRHIVSWNAEGNGFMVHDASVFLKTIIPQYFNQTKYKSFQRQLSLYGFTRIAAGRRKGLRFHPNFARGSKLLCKQMRPITKPKESKASPASSNTTTTSISPKPTEKAAPEKPENVVPQTQISKGPSLVPSDSQCSLVDQSPTANEMVGGEKRYMISPASEPAPIAPKLDPSLFALLEEDIGCFEGNTFFLMNSTSLRNRPEPLSIPTFDPVVTTSDDAMRSQLRHAWEQGFAKALAIPPTLVSKPLASINDDPCGLDFWSQSNIFVV
jgi:hypothetical protein